VLLIEVLLTEKKHDRLIPISVIESSLVNDGNSMNRQDAKDAKNSNCPLFSSALTYIGYAGLNNN
jgi:hypothetical protein